MDIFQPMTRDAYDVKNFLTAFEVIQNNDDEKFSKLLDFKLDVLKREFLELFMALKLKN